VRPAVIRRRPGRLLRIALKAPALAYRAGAGRVLGHRFLLLTHRGRVSGRIYRTPLEVVRWDGRRREATVVSAWGRRADWLRNITTTPPLEVQIAGERWRRPASRMLEVAETAELLEAYRRDHRIAARILAGVLGWPITGADADLRAIAGSIPAVAFRPQNGSLSDDPPPAGSPAPRPEL
jgi:deazaflavin-dependent oxidoreductase (nitroreductase family)